MGLSLFVIKSHPEATTMKYLKLVLAAIVGFVLGAALFCCSTLPHTW
jgi:hypothetical protein